MNVSEPNCLTAMQKEGYRGTPPSHFAPGLGGVPVLSGCATSAKWLVFLYGTEP